MVKGRANVGLSDANLVRDKILWAFLVLGFVVVWGRFFQIQILDAGAMVDRAHRQHQEVVEVDPGRGAILDNHGRVLAINTAVPSIFATPGEVANPDRTARQLAPHLGVSSREIESKLRQDRNFVWIKRKVQASESQKIESLAAEGIGVVMEEKRFYPKRELLAHILGFAGIDSQGLEGLEMQYDPYLRGDVRTVRSDRDANGRRIYSIDGKGEATTSGHTITLTIDEVIQYIAENELQAGVAKTSAQSGTLIAMDPQSGAILAWALFPTFDPNTLSTASAERWRNRAITDPYEPGSTLKVVSFAASLEEKEVEPGSLVYAGHGEVTIGGTRIHDHTKSGWVTIAQGLEQSSNVVAVKLAMALGNERLYRYLRAFGFGEKTEIDLPGESAGLLKDPEHWGKRTLASIAIGQEIGVTPLQMLTAVSAIANKGWLTKPYVVKEIRDASGALVGQHAGDVRRRPVSDETARTLTDMLVGVVESGTGKQAAIPGFHVAGKTGTAQKFDSAKGVYSATRLIGSFVGYAPAEDPRIAIIVILDEPKGPAWGGVVAAPIFRRVAERVLRHLQVPPVYESPAVTVAAA